MNKRRSHSTQSNVNRAAPIQSGFVRCTLTYSVTALLVLAMVTAFGVASAANRGARIQAVKFQSFNQTYKAIEPITPFTRRYYIGLGGGKSRLDPNTEELPDINTNHRVNESIHLMLGVDFNKWFSVEGHVSELGEAGFFPEGTLGYQTAGLSTLFYAGKGRQRFNRQGLTGYGRIGVGYLNNTPSEGLQYERVNAVHALVGLGLEYALAGGLGMRLEAISFDEDVQVGLFSLLYRFGRASGQAWEAETPATLPVEPKPVITQAPASVVAKRPIRVSDNDSDGVQDRLDHCPGTLPKVPVNKHGCDAFVGAIEGVNFESGSANLTAQATLILDDVVSTLQRFPQVRIRILAHTDNQGDARSNQTLSRARALSVARYLVHNGVDVSRLKAFGFGESKPIATNASAEGRRKNRRVEFFVEPE